MSPRPSQHQQTIFDAATRIGISEEEATRAIALMMSGRSDLLSAVISGQMKLRDALKAANDTCR